MYVAATASGTRLQLQCSRTGRRLWHMQTYVHCYSWMLFPRHRCCKQCVAWALLAAVVCNRKRTAHLAHDDLNRSARSASVCTCCMSSLASSLSSSHSSANSESSPSEGSSKPNSASLSSSLGSSKSSSSISDIEYNVSAVDAADSAAGKKARHHEWNESYQLAERKASINDLVTLALEAVNLP